MAGVDLFGEKSWMGGFVQFANPIPPGPRVFGPPPYGIWTVSYARPQVPPVVVSEETLCEMHRREDLLERGRATVEAGLGQGGPVAPYPVNEHPVLPIVKTDYVALVGGIVVA